MMPCCEIRPSVGFRPTTSVRFAGAVIDPSVSDPTAAAQRLAAAAIAGPELDPGRGVVEHVRVMRNTAARRPAVEIDVVEREEPAEVCPLAQVGLAENHRAGRAQLCHQRRIGGHAAADERQRTGRRLHLIVGRDVVFEENRDAVQWTTQAAAALRVEPRRGRFGIRVRFNDGVQQRIQIRDALEITARELLTCERTGDHHRLKLRDGRFHPRWIARREYGPGPRREERADAARQKGGTACGSRAEKRASCDTVRGLAVFVQILKRHGALHWGWEAEVGKLRAAILAPNVKAGRSGTRRREKVDAEETNTPPSP